METRFPGGLMLCGRAALTIAREPLVSHGHELPAVWAKPSEANSPMIRKPDDSQTP